jgi:hypothetical protein
MKMLATEKVRHECGKLGWAQCTVCLGRLHHTGCTSRRNPDKDCCKARHQKLFDQGKTVGLDDSSQPMLPEKWRR